jgi:threonine aldolase
VIDLRSDWVAPPTEAMWEAMRAADRRALPLLEGRVSDLLGKDAAVWTPTCSVANLAALLTLCEPGNRVALDDDAHILTTEGMGIEHVAHLQPVALEDAGRATLVCLENTRTRRGGTILDVDETTRLGALAQRSHLDGARLPNAAAALGVPMAELAAPVETVALSLNKGLGAPAGAVLAGNTSAIEEAGVHLRRVGAASVHQAYRLAAAGLVALDRLDEIGDDNLRARDLGERLAALDGVEVERPATNILFFSVAGRDARRVLADLERNGVLGYLVDERRVRFVTHGEIGDAQVGRAAAAVATVAATGPG